MLICYNSNAIHCKLIDYENASIPMMCDFERFDDCGFVDRSFSRLARWILKSQASQDNGK